MKPTCSIVIRAFNEEAHIGRLLEGIHHQSVKDVQIIVVDSGSTDQTVEIAHRDGAEVVHINPRDFTFGRSLNLGVSYAKADIVVIASAHVYPVYPDWLERLLEPFKDSDTAMTYGKQRGPEMSQFSENQIFTHWYPDESQLNQCHPFCNNANASIRRSIWEKQPYDENLPALEDLAWAKWALENGYKLSYVAEAEIIHVHNESPRGIFNRYRREGMAFKQIYPHEHFRLGDVARLFMTNVISDAKVAVRGKLFFHQILKIINFRWNQFWGTYQGYRQSGPLTWQLKRSFYYPRSINLKSENNHKTREVSPITYSQTLGQPDQKLGNSAGGRNERQ